MSPAKKPPRPVTMWCGWSRVGSLTWLTAADGLAMERGDISPDEAADESGSIRCRVTPIRPATDAEITKLALHLANVEHAAMVAAGHRRPGKVVGAGSGFIAVAREAWKRGAR